jgi:hypothetical protein
MQEVGQEVGGVARARLTHDKFITKQRPNLSYIKILRLLTYTLMPKSKRGGKTLFIKANKGILIGFESSNNFIVYLLYENKFIISRDVIIKEKLNYKDDYKLGEDYLNLFI